MSNENNTHMSVVESKPFAIIETGGKQYKVTEGDTLLVELFSELSDEGQIIQFDKVLLKDDGNKIDLGNPYIKGSHVTAFNLGEIKGKKLSIIRFKAKSNRSRKLGHRQRYLKVKIDNIS